MILLACGGRDYHNRDKVFSTLDRIHEKKKITGIIEGAATGADALAAEWAVLKGITVCECSGGDRERLMVSVIRPDGAVVFGGGAESSDIISRLHAADVTVMDVDRADNWEAGS